MEGCEAQGCEAHLQYKKKRISLFIHTYYSSWEAFFRCQESLNWMMASIKWCLIKNFPCFSSYQVRQWHSYSAPSPASWILKWDHCRAKFKQKQTERAVFINNNLSILFAVSCVSASQTITRSPLPSRAISRTVLELTRFIYSCKSYFKWLTSKRLVYRAKWRAASPFKAASVFLFLPPKLRCRVRGI